MGSAYKHIKVGLTILGWLTIDSSAEFTKGVAIKIASDAHQFLLILNDTQDTDFEARPRKVRENSTAVLKTCKINRHVGGTERVNDAGAEKYAAVPKEGRKTL